MTSADVRADMPARDREHVLALYDGEIRFTDDNLGAILGELRARGMLENTLVVVTADHGEEFFEHGQKGHQKTLFDEVVRVPLVMSWPRRLDAGRVVRDQVRTIDLMPTLLDAAGARDLPRMQGRSLLPLARGAKLAPAPALCELHADGRDQRALRAPDLKAYAVGHGPDGQVLPSFGLDLKHDALEQRPLAPEADPRIPPALQRLERAYQPSRELGAWLGAPARAVRIDPLLQRRLEELGY
jgi:arylsulfatase A-like enzyme